MSCAAGYVLGRWGRHCNTKRLTVAQNHRRIKTGIGSFELVAILALFVGMDLAQVGLQVAAAAAVAAVRIVQCAHACMAWGRDVSAANDVKTDVISTLVRGGT
eukprot:6482574-Amphidinium_carterae.2